MGTVALLSTAERMGWFGFRLASSQSWALTVDMSWLSKLRAYTFVWTVASYVALLIAFITLISHLSPSLLLVVPRNAAPLPRWL